MGTCPEYAIVVPGKTSSSSVKLESLDGTYTITYHDGETSTTAKYTRHTKVVLPNIESPAVSKEGYEFCGWFATNADAQGYTATAITEIPENTVGAQKFYAKYMSLADVTPIKSVKIEGDVKVGKTLKAVPYTKESNPAESDKFTGEIASYKWYVGEDSNNDGSISDSEWQLIDGATTAEYKILPADLGKSIRAEIVQKYTVEADTEKKIYVVKTENAPVSSDKSVNPVQKGALSESAINEYISALSVNPKENTAGTLANPILIGTPLSLTIDSKSETVKDTENNDVDITVSFTVPEQNAPETSNYVPVNVTITATGYEDVVKNLLATETSPSPLFVYVKANPITTVPTLKVEDSDNPTITTGYVMIGTGLPASGEMAYQYAVVADSEDATKPASDATWADLTSSEFKKGETHFVSGDKIFIRKKGAEGTEDENYNKVGYVAPSEPCFITVATTNIGNKNAIKITEITVTGLTDITVTKSETESETDTITLSVTNASSYSDFTWQAVESSALTVTPDGTSGTATVTFASGTVPGTYGVVLTAKTALATYSTTVYITLSN